MTVDASSELWAQIPSWEDMGLSQQVGNDHALCECVCVCEIQNVLQMKAVVLKGFHLQSMVGGVPQL